MGLEKKQRRKRERSWAVNWSINAWNNGSKNIVEEKYLGNHANYEALLLNVICLDGLVILKDLSYRRIRLVTELVDRDKNVRHCNIPE